VLIVAGFVVGHDEGNNLIPVQVIRNPTTNLPSTSHDEMNLSMGAPHGPFSSVASFFQDTGSAMGGGRRHHVGAIHRGRTRTPTSCASQRSCGPTTPSA
jgi:hypothetical protein